MLLLISLSSGVAAITELPQPYVPAGQNYSITALQDLTPVTLTGGTSVGANPNLNFEFQGGIGVRYLSPAGKLTDFGIGLYDGSTAKGFQATSTGLNISFDQLVSSNGLSATLGDFDVTSLSSGFNTGKVSPTISIYGAGGSLLGDFSASDILAGNAMSLISGHDPAYKVDTWLLSLDALVGSNAQISGFTLAADVDNGAGCQMDGTSDPYFLISVNNACPVPEPGSAFLVFTAALGALIITRRRNLFPAA
ncbi:PEP-CTERM sorting domain-containing protein [Prosthecobacter sp.]|uniref:PEP-CTERM sorting domain-containing protein n=1 Tax=Prosthecobacter sp. TaxID=1965333 RepID=UPI001DC0E294|nr:PEP-CTERM sorting domain-containing protein [Prosthecobacter sp.]MCB1278539.1 PEP-CTERM sorting domain-containing protein [Prosthecobacter sp.]